MNIYTAFAVHISIIPSIYRALKRVLLLPFLCSVQPLRPYCSISAVVLFNLGGQTVQLGRSRCSVFRGILILPECRFYIPKVIAFTITPRNLTAASLRSYHRKVISHSDGHSVVTDFWATKKAGTSKWYVPTLKGQNSPVKGKLVITFRCNRL